MDHTTITNPIAFPDNSPEENAPPAYFLSLAVAGFRCFGPKQVLDLSDGQGRPARWTIILGDNGVGKTTLLQCLAALQPRMTKIQEYEGFFPVFSSIDAMQFVNDWLFRTNVGKDPFFLGSTIYQGAKLEDMQEGTIIDNFSVSGASSASDSAKFSRTSKNIQGLVCYGYGASRRMGKTSLTERRDQDTSASLFSDNVELLNAEEWLLQADYAASKRSRGQRRAQARRDQIKQILIDLLPDVEDIRFAVSHNNEMEPIVEIKTPYGWVPLQGLSLGYRTLITWMVDLASRLFDRYPHSKNPIAEPAVVLVDEIDLHLHPKWQRTLMRFLSEIFRNTQFIATAHSPLVVQAAMNANLVLLQRKGNHVVIDNDVKTIRGWRVDQVLTSDLFGLDSARPPILDSALKERRKILSKGKLTKADKEKLQEIEAEIGNLPSGETPDDIEAMDIIHRAAELLKNR